MVGVQLFAVRDENMLFSLEVLLLLGRRVVTRGTGGGSGKKGSVMAGTKGAGIGSEIWTSTGSVSELSGVLMWGQQVVGTLVRVGPSFSFWWVFCRPIVSVVYGEDRVSGGIETV